MSKGTMEHHEESGKSLTKKKKTPEDRKEWETKAEKKTVQAQ